MPTAKQFFLRFSFFWILELTKISSGWFSDLSPADISYNRCKNNFDCNQSFGQTCVHLYEGCDGRGRIGICMCDHPAKIIDDKGRCVPSLGMEACTSDDMCIEGMICKKEICQCANGRMTSDRLHCLRHNQRLLGDRCSPADNKCLHKAASGYTAGDVTCSANGVCACAVGYKADGISCIRWKVYETGCMRSYHCEGGAICVDSQCVCPTGYATTKASSKCIKIGAITNVALGGECDEINERSYCSADLVCHTCASSAKAYYCVKFLLASDYGISSAGSLSLTKRRPSHIFSVGLIVFTTFYHFITILVTR